MNVPRRLSALCVTALCAGALAASALATPGAADAAEAEWGPLQQADGHTLAVALGDRTTALVSVGGADEATVYDQRRTATGALGPVTAVMTVPGAAYCRPVEAVTELSNLAVAVECQQTTGLEDPPTTLVELVWTGDDGWVWRVQDEGELGSLDYSPGGQFVVFTSDSRYGRAHHVTSYHADLGWRDLTRRERGSGEGLVAAISDGGDVVALRGAGSEDEPGYWYGGRLALETYDATSRRWTRRFSRAYPDGGIRPAGIDLSAGRIAASVVESRSTGEPDGLADRVVLLSGRPGSPRFSTSAPWGRQVLTSHAAITRAGVGVFAWQAADGRRSARPWFATWAPGRARPGVHDLRWRTTLTDAAVSGRALDLAVSASGRSAIAYVRHRRGADHATVGGASFRVGRHGGVRRPVDVTWQQPVETTVDATASATSTSITLGVLTSPFTSSTRTQYSLGP